MDLNSLKSFARDARKELLKTVALKIEYVLSEDSPAKRENSKGVDELNQKINTIGKDLVIEKVSYTWFNRFTALQYMDINGFNNVKVISQANGEKRPEILANAIRGLFDKNLITENTKNIVSALLDGRSSSNNPEQEAYRLLIVAICNNFHSNMPFLFERIADYTELLMPDDLLSKTSILEKIRHVMTEENCKDVEVIGWLYQFYISEKKEKIRLDIKKNKKVMPEDIPAATQLFTPHWIVKYLVQNSLGRLWLLNNPNTQIINYLEYFVPSKDSEENFLKINSPEEIKICDPACGSGHMLTYCFDILYLIYEEEGYDPATIPSLIIKNNLFGVEIDQRAGTLSAFALTMKAREKQQLFLENPVQPNICVIENIDFESDEIKNYMDEVGRDLFTNNLQKTLNQFRESNNYGSLIEPALDDINSTLQILESKNISYNIFLKNTHDRVLRVLNQANYLRQKYHVVIANPPYMGAQEMNPNLSYFANKFFPDSKSDLFAMFMERSENFLKSKGFFALVTMESWMFIASYEKLRLKLLAKNSIVSMTHMDNMVMGIAFGTSATIFNKISDSTKTGSYCHIEYKDLNDKKVPFKFPPENKRNLTSNSKDKFFWVISKNFEKIPGSPIAYWISKKISDLFIQNEFIGTKAKKGLTTGKNDQFIRYWFEPSINKFSVFKGQKWFPTTKGGKFRKWYGNFEFVLLWEEDGKDIKNFKFPNGKLRSVIRNKDYYYKSGLTWTGVSNSKISIRFVPEGFIFNAAGPTIFTNDENGIIASMNSKLIDSVSKFISPTLNFEVGQIQKYPILKSSNRNRNIAQSCIDISKKDWDSFETSWDFKTSPLLAMKGNSKSLQTTYNCLRMEWQKWTDEMLNLEEENNQIFIDAYDLNDELEKNVSLQDITLSRNPAYRYGIKISRDMQEEKLLRDTIKEFISYSVGCMFGRYSVDIPGLIIANQGEDLKSYFRSVPNPSYIPDDDNIIPILSLDWFEDDINERFRKFLRNTFGNNSFEENIRFIERALGKNTRKYFLNDFYNDHIQTYKKTPIYWMFSSPKGSFNVLIYMHRYCRDTIPIMLDKYLREFLLKLNAEKNNLERIEISSSASSSEKTSAMREMQKIDNILQELNSWEKDVVFPLASQRLEINLDDGVKTNYPKFGIALKKISGLN